MANELFLTVGANLAQSRGQEDGQEDGQEFEVLSVLGRTEVGVVLAEQHDQ